MHSARFFLASLMIVTTKMQNAVDQQEGDLLIHGLLGFFRLSPGCGNRDHHITQHILQTAQGPVLSQSTDVRRDGFAHRKCQHIGRAILTPIPTIETPHPLIAHEEDTQLRRRFPHIGKNRSCQPTQMRHINRYTSNMTLYMDRHCSGSGVQTEG